MQKFRVCEIYRAIQGEGAIWSGHPCTIVRFQGCNLRCDFCDTPQALSRKGGHEIDIVKLFFTIKNANGSRDDDIILFTGGEPMLQPVVELLNIIHSETLWTVHLETNGTRPINGAFDWVVVSPKRGNDGAVRYHEFAIKAADEIKWLVRDQTDIDALRDFLHETSFSDVISIQPVSLDESATKIAYDAALEYGWRLSLQLHKLVKGIGDEQAIRAVLPT